MTEHKHGVLLTLASTVACGICADIGLFWTAMAFGCVAIASGIYCAAAWIADCDIPQRTARAEGRSDVSETRTDLWNPFGNDDMRHMESADVTGGATDMADDALERDGLRR